jgi:hypothetical protein
MNNSTAAVVPIAIPALAPAESGLVLAEEVFFEAAVEIAPFDSAGMLVAKEEVVRGKLSEVIVKRLGIMAELGIVELVGGVIPKLDVVAADGIGSIIEDTVEFEVPVASPSWADNAIL